MKGTPVDGSHVCMRTRCTALPRFSLKLMKAGCLRFGRMLGLPSFRKGPTRGDRRPLTVLPVTYRLWAKRHAAALTQWLMLWKLCGLSGALPKHNCPDVLWRLQAELAQARLGESDPWYVLSMDLEKCFDRLDIPNLRDLCSYLGLHVCDHVLRMYSRLTRVLFVDNMPTDVWLQGSGLVGVPQGCPLA